MPNLLFQHAPSILCTFAPRLNGPEKKLASNRKMYKNLGRGRGFESRIELSYLSFCYSTAVHFLDVAIQRKPIFLDMGLYAHAKFNQFKNRTTFILNRGGECGPLDFLICPSSCCCSISQPHQKFYMFK